MKGADTGGVQRVGDHLPYGAHIPGAVGGACAIPRSIPQPRGGAVGLGSVGVHHQNLGLVTVQLDVKGQPPGSSGSGFGR